MRYEYLASSFVTFFLTLIAVLFVIDNNTVFEQKTILITFNTLFICFIPLFLTYTMYKIFYITGNSQLFFFGSGLLFMGLGAFLSGWVLKMVGGGPNVNATVHNTNVLFCALCHVIGYVTKFQIEEKKRSILLFCSIPVIIITITTLVLSALHEFTPPYIIQGVGPTIIGRAVLGTIIIVFTLSAILGINQYKKENFGSEQVRWYATGLGLFAIGMFGVFLQKAVGTPIGWAGRSAQFFGGICLLIGGLSFWRNILSTEKSFKEAINILFKEAKDSYEALINNAPDGILSIDKEGHILLWNYSAELMFGYSQQKMVGLLFSELLEDNNFKNFNGQILPPVIETMAKGDKGKIFPVELSISRRSSEVGPITTFIIKDITERKKLEQEITNRTQQLKEEMNKVSDLINNMRQSVFTVNKDGIIMSPVSKFSQEIFGIDLVGKNIFDIIYKSIDHNSEEFSLLRTSFLGVFDGSELQWISVENHFPKKIFFNFNGNIKKILKISYAPIWNNSTNLEKIMLIIEDVTEIEMLEIEVKFQKEENEKRMKILQELASQSPDDLKRFFDDTFKLIELCYSIVSKVENNKELSGDLFRNLHTIKGNSRIFGFNMISQATHEVESLAIELCKNIKKENNNIHSQIKNISLGLDRVFFSFQEYSDFAEGLLKIENEHKKNMIIHLHEKVINLELALYLKKSLSTNIHNDECIKKLDGLIYQLIDDSSEKIRRIGNEQVISHVNKLKKSFIERRDEEEFKKSLNDLGTSIKGMFIHSNLFRPYEIDATKLASIFLLTHKITTSYKDLLLKDNHSKGSFYALIGDANEESRRLNQGFASVIFLHIQDILKNDLNLSESFIEIMVKKALGFLWNHLAFISHLNIYLLFNEKEVSYLRDTVLLMSRIENHEEIIQKSQELFLKMGNNCLITYFFKIFILEEKKLPKDFLGLFEEMSGVKGHNAIDFFIPTIKKDHFEVDSYFFKIYDGNLNKNLSQVFKNMDTEMGSHVMDLWSDKDNFIDDIPYLYTIEFLQYVGGYISEERILSKTAHTIDLVDQNVYKLKDFINHEFPQMSNYNGYLKLCELSQRLFDIPLRPALIKYFSMVKDLSLKFEKKINFKIEGVEIMLDRNRLTLVTDSLTHILRNAIDHGLETPDERLRLKKSEQGTLKIILSHQGKNINIDVIDDGRGIDFKKLKDKALEMKLITLEELEKMKPDFTSLVFIPGLSTKEDASEISGRGIGMDAVTTNIKKLGGNISVTSTEEKGSIFRIQFTIP